LRKNVWRPAWHSSAGDTGPHRKPPATAKGQNVILRDSSLSLFSSLRCSCSARKLRNGPAHQRQRAAQQHRQHAPLRSGSAANGTHFRAVWHGACSRGLHGESAAWPHARLFDTQHFALHAHALAGDSLQVSARATHREETCDSEQDALARCGILLVVRILAFVAHRRCPGSKSGAAVYPTSAGYADRYQIPGTSRFLVSVTASNFGPFLGPFSFLFRRPPRPRPWPGARHSTRSP